MVIRTCLYTSVGVEVFIEEEVIDWEDEDTVYLQVKDLAARTKRIQEDLDAEAEKPSGVLYASGVRPTDEV